MHLEGKETEEANIRRSVGGTTGILQACLNSKTVKRVVYTSSGSTVMINEKNQVDETMWSDVDFMRTRFAKKLVARYAITKMSSERAALEFAERNGLDLVSIIPTWVHGPFICPSLPGSVRSSMALIFGHKEDYSRLLRTCFVHTDDLARAYIFLFEYPNAKGSSLKDITGFPYAVVSSKKLLDTGFKYHYGID